MTGQRCDSCGQEMQKHIETKYKEMTVFHCPETEIQRADREMWDRVKAIVESKDPIDFDLF